MPRGPAARSCCSGARPRPRGTRTPSRPSTHRCSSTAWRSPSSKRTSSWPGVEGYATRLVAHRPAPLAAVDDAVRPQRARAFPLAVGILEVVEMVRLSPNMRRVVLTGPQIAELPVREPGEIITLIWPAPGSTEIVLPPPRRWRFPESGRDQPVRNLTIRNLDRPRGRLTIDFFMHAHDGPASGWARRAAPGDVVGFGGPRPHWVTDETADWTLLIGDETALPAIGAIAESPARRAPHDCGHRGREFRRGARAHRPQHCRVALAPPRGAPARPRECARRGGRGAGAARRLSRGLGGGRVAAHASRARAPA